MTAKYLVISDHSEAVESIYFVIDYTYFHELCDIPCFRLAISYVLVNICLIVICFLSFVYICIVLN